jgi:hypothetical protein
MCKRRFVVPAFWAVLTAKEKLAKAVAILNDPYQDVLGLRTGCSG